jgi:hypothetical protein
VIHVSSVTFVVPLPSLATSDSKQTQYHLPRRRAAGRAMQLDNGCILRQTEDIHSKQQDWRGTGALQNGGIHRRRNSSNWWNGATQH